MRLSSPVSRPRNKTGARAALVLVCSTQLRVVGARELCDEGHRQAGCFTPWWVVAGAFKWAHTSTISAFGTSTGQRSGPFFSMSSAKA